MKKTAVHKKGMLLPLLLPPAIWLFLFLFLPYLNLFSYSFWKPGPFDVVKEFTLHNYAKFFTATSSGSVPYHVLIDTVELALVVTVFTVILSFPLAYYLNFKVTRFKQTIYMLVIIPLWVSYIVRAYSWKIILGTNGILNSAFIWLGVTDHPLDIFLYSKVSVIIGMVHIYTPFVLMPIYTALEQIPRNLLEASKDLGAGRFQSFLHVVVPLALPGVIAGATFAFVLSMGDFLAPSLLGGPDSSTMIANIVQQQFGTSNNWPYGSAIGIVILVLVLAILELTGRAEKRFSALDTVAMRK
ncbi:ABC transporter permease [Brevibacillus sp. SYP-B805]|uniref:ABC transporter permease n=1 Tax=Brevibacillus sp. SYP-B805 TaxID=1578199 RepID=UPI0013EDC6F7|nr:ABC transporter permease [Brevibacillus sp. SYP-B805]NGQ96772.1 ABC transporter permease [Brevibacillus sp. SYP-B805]